MANMQPYLQKQLDELIAGARPNENKWSAYRMNIARYLRDGKKFAKGFSNLPTRSQVLAAACANAKRDFKSSKLGPKLRFRAYEFLEWKKVNERK